MEFLRYIPFPKNDTFNLFWDIFFYSTYVFAIPLINGITAREISEINNVPLRTVQRAISRLEKLNLIDCVSSNKAIYWKILK